MINICTFYIDDLVQDCSNSSALAMNGVTAVLHSAIDIFNHHVGYLSGFDFTLSQDPTFSWELLIESLQNF